MEGKFLLIIMAKKYDSVLFGPNNFYLLFERRILYQKYFIGIMEVSCLV